MQFFLHPLFHSNKDDYFFLPVFILIMWFSEQTVSSFLLVLNLVNSAAKVQINMWRHPPYTWPDLGIMMTSNIGLKSQIFFSWCMLWIIAICTWTLINKKGENLTHITVQLTWHCISISYFFFGGGGVFFFIAENFLTIKKTLCLDS